MSVSADKRWSLRGGHRARRGVVALGLTVLLGCESWARPARAENPESNAARAEPRQTSIFLRGEEDRRPVHGGARKFQEDPHWRDYALFYEYFHGDNGAGLGASHQTGWTGIIARAMHLFATSTAEQFLELGKAAAVTEREPARSGQTAGGAPGCKR